jgi:hypothetical protein
VICLHFNAEPWGDATNPQLVDQNHLHFLIAGALSEKELAYEDQRYDMLVKLLNRSFLEEFALTNLVSRKMAAATGLPPYFYRSGTAIRVNDNPYVWARNLLANRLFVCPVIYIEPYVMNSRLVFARIQAGDYEGRRNFGGVMRKSIIASMPMRLQMASSRIIQDVPCENHCRRQPKGWSGKNHNLPEPLRRAVRTRRARHPGRS